MIIKFGFNPINPVNGRPAHAGAPGMSVTKIADWTNEDGSYVANYKVGTNAQEVSDHLFECGSATEQNLVTRLQGQEAILDVWHTLRPYLSIGEWPKWVHVEPEQRTEEHAADFERFWSEFYRCDRGEPADIEDTHYTLRNGVEYAPGDRPAEG